MKNLTTQGKTNNSELQWSNACKFIYRFRQAAMIEMIRFSFPTKVVAEFRQRRAKRIMLNELETALISINCFFFLELIILRTTVLRATIRSSNWCVVSYFWSLTRLKSTNTQTRKKLSDSKSWKQKEPDGWQWFHLANHLWVRPRIEQTSRQIVDLRVTELNQCG